MSMTQQLLCRVLNFLTFKKSLPCRHRETDQKSSPRTHPVVPPTRRQWMERIKGAKGAARHLE